MASVVIPYRGPGGKERFRPAPAEVRAALALAMLGDVLGACAAVGRMLLVTKDEESVRAYAEEAGAEIVLDPGGGQGAAVAAALAKVEEWPALVVNADLPCVQSRDVLALLGSLPGGGIALVPARDGTTNALALSGPLLYAPVYGPGSAARFGERAARLDAEIAVTEIPNLVEDVDTLADLERLEGLLGRRTQAALESLRAGLAR